MDRNISAGARHPVLDFHESGSLSGNEIGSNSLPADNR